MSLIPCMAASQPICPLPSIANEAHVSQLKFVETIEGFYPAIPRFFFALVLFVLTKE